MLVRWCCWAFGVDVMAGRTTGSTDRSATQIQWKWSFWPSKDLLQGFFTKKKVLQTVLNSLFAGEQGRVGE